MAKSYSQVASPEIVMEIKSKEDFGYRPWSVIIKTRELSVTPIEVLDALKDQYDPYSIQKTQFADYLVTVKTPEQKERILREGKVKIGETEVGVQDPDTNTTYVSVFYSPFEIAEEFYEERLKEYGKIKYVKRNKIPDTDVENGITTVCIDLERHIPSFLQVGAYTVMMRYNGQPRTCRKCDQVGHLATACKEVRCFNCGSPGHVKRICPKHRVCSLCREPNHSLGDCPTFWYPSMAVHELEVQGDTKMEEDEVVGVQKPDESQVPTAVVAVQKPDETQVPTAVLKRKASVSSVSSVESTASNRSTSQQTSKRPLSSNSKDSEKVDRNRKKQAVKEDTREKRQEKERQIKGLLGMKGLPHEQIMDMLEKAKTQRLFENLWEHALMAKPLMEELSKCLS